MEIIILVQNLFLPPLCENSNRCNGILQVFDAFSLNSWNSCKIIIFMKILISAPKTNISMKFIILVEMLIFAIFASNNPRLPSRSYPEIGNPAIPSHGFEPAATIGTNWDDEWRMMILCWEMFFRVNIVNEKAFPDDENHFLCVNTSGNGTL